MDLLNARSAYKPRAYVLVLALFGNGTNEIEPGRNVCAYNKHQLNEEDGAYIRWASSIS